MSQIHVPDYVLPSELPMDGNPLKTANRVLCFDLMDQWVGRSPNQVRSRHIQARGSHATNYTASNNADAYYIVETP